MTWRRPSVKQKESGGGKRRREGKIISYKKDTWVVFITQFDTNTKENTLFIFSLPNERKETSSFPLFFGSLLAHPPPTTADDRT